MPVAVSSDDQKEQLPLSKSGEFLLDECRMVLPGIQALFGFQLIAVFNSGFSQMLDPFEQRLHLFSLCLTVIAIAFVMTPAAFHRQMGSKEVSQKFIRLASRLLLFGMWPLAFALCVDFYLIAGIIVGHSYASLLATGLGGIFIGLWFVFPRMNKTSSAPSK